MRICNSCLAIPGTDKYTSAKSLTGCRDFPGADIVITKNRLSQTTPASSNYVAPMTTSDVKQPLILCIDDSEIALRVRMLLLRSAGYAVLIAPSGEDGLQLFKQNSIDLVIADHFLSDTSGAEIAAEMKQIKPQVPILIVSAATEAPKGLDFADGFLSKGEGPDALLDKVVQLLRERQTGH
jgi:CheY-like chemotaxis protein